MNKSKEEVFMAVLGIVLAILTVFAGITVFRKTIGKDMFKISERKRKYEQMEYMKDSLTVEALKRNIKIYEEETSK